MKYKFFVAIIAVIVLAGCNGKAITFNNKIAEIEQSVIADAQKAQAKLEGYYQNQDWDKMAKEAKKTETTANDKVSELKDLEVPDLEGASAFKKAEVNYLANIKKMFTCYRKIGEAETDQDRQTEVANMQQISQDREDARLEVKRTQGEYVKANKIKMKDDDKTTDDDDKTPKKKKTTDD